MREQTFIIRWAGIWWKPSTWHSWAVVFTRVNKPFGKEVALFCGKFAKYKAAHRAYVLANRLLDANSRYWRNESIPWLEFRPSDYGAHRPRRKLLW